MRESLLTLEAETAPAARSRISELESRHGVRREWVWADLGQSPLAQALLHLAALADATGSPPGFGTTEELSEWYASEGWRVDARVMDALAVVQLEKDAAAVRAAVRSVYADWLEECARRFQRAVKFGGIPPTQSLDPDGPEPGVCTLFTDGLRYDLAQRLSEMLSGHDAKIYIGWRYTALPGVTPRPSPCCSRPRAPTQARQRIRCGDRRLQGNCPEPSEGCSSERGYQILQDGRGRGPFGIVVDGARRSGRSGPHPRFEDGAGGGELAPRSRGADTALLEAGWREVRVVTDHGWLLLPGGLPKVDLPEHLTVVRKGPLRPPQERRAHRSADRALVPRPQV